jgi:GNAT superfamily N-acetyltransferase
MSIIKYNNYHYAIIKDYGYCEFDIYDRLIFNLYIEKEFRRKGYAKKIIRLAINFIKKTSKSNDYIFIEAFPRENSISIYDLIKFYNKMGLKVINKSPY